MIAATVHPMPGRKITGPLPPPQQGRVPDPAARLPISEIPPPVRPAHSWLGPEGIEPRRKHRIARERGAKPAFTIQPDERLMDQVQQLPLRFRRRQKWIYVFYLNTRREK